MPAPPEDCSTVGRKDEGPSHFELPLLPDTTLRIPSSMTGWFLFLEQIPPIIYFVLNLSLKLMKYAVK